MAEILEKSSWFQDQSIAVIQASFRGSFLADEESRMTAAENRLRILWDDFADLVSSKVKTIVDSDTWLNPETEKGLKDYIDVSNNVYKAIIKQLAMLYKKTPIREFSDNEERFNEIYGIRERSGVKTSLFDSKFRKANEYVQAVNDVYLYFVYRDDRIDIDVLTPNNLHIIADKDNPTKPEFIMIKRSLDMIAMEEFRTQGENYYIVWSKSEHYYLVERGGIWVREAIDGNEDMINPYGILPFVGIHKSDNETMWNETEGADLYELGIWVAVFNTIWNQNWTWHNFKQLAVSTDDGQKLPVGLGRAPDRVLVMPGDSQVNVLDWSVDTSKLLEDIETKAAIVAAKHGVDLKAAMSELEESGVKLRIRQSVLREQREDQVKVFTKGEMESFEIIKAIMAYIDGAEIKGEMTIKYHDMEVFQDTTEQLNISEKEMALDLTSIVDVYLAKNPYMAREEAIEKLKQNIEENNQLRQVKDKSIIEEIEK